ncbi:MAG: hypothetical protein GY724_02315 [Actinomycetia bacterium]|nr:hypothetical protein [Actinomycetes bacterium]MCP4224015.1 hypothetical protein [Actinomycetes bacterium]MCP5031548.1 hypothetical protein [Actinomycetes bacterium]
MHFARRLGAWIVLVLGSIAFLIALFLALASLVSAGSSETRIESDTADAANGTVAPDLDSPTRSVPASDAPAGPQTSVPYQFNGNDGSISCYRAASGASAGSYVVQVVAITPVTGDLTVGVELVSRDGTHQSRAVSIPAESGSEVVTMIVPDSNGADPFIDCTISAIQSGQRVIITGR